METRTGNHPAQLHRYRLDALRGEAGRLHLRGRPFTGIVYDVQGDRVTANYRVTDGVRNGPAEAWDPVRPRVLFKALTFVEPEQTNAQFPTEGDYLDGVFFDGVAYAFDNDTGMLLKEQDFRPEPPAPCREWYRSGALQADRDRVRPDGAWESETYYENGQTSGVHMRSMGWDITPEGRLRTLRLLPGYPEGDLQRTPSEVDSRLYLAGHGVTDQIVERLEDLGQLQHLHLDSTNISAEVLRQLRVIVNLKELVTRNNTGFGEAELRKLLVGLPGCKWDSR
jgi:hypothetical protein